MRPGRAPRVSNEIFSGRDWFPTLLAAAGDPTVKERLLQGASCGGTTYKVHLDEPPRCSRTGLYLSFCDAARLRSAPR